MTHVNKLACTMKSRNTFFYTFFKKSNLIKVAVL